MSFQATEHGAHGRGELEPERLPEDFAHSAQEAQERRENMARGQVASKAVRQGNFLLLVAV